MAGPPDPRWRHYRLGSRLVLPALVGTFSWGVVTGVAMVKAGMDVRQALAMSIVVYSGTAILATLPLLAAGASLPLICLAALLANLRFVVYSAVVAGEFRKVPGRVKLAIGHLTTDSGLAAYLADTPRGTPQAQRTARFLGANLPVFVAWQVGAIGGILLAGTLPDWPRLSFVGVLAIMALVGPMLRSIPAVAAAAAAAGVAMVGRDWSYQGGMLSAIVAGVAVALLLDRGARR
jgi:predicted branched-subunit amino acid permease